MNKGYALTTRRLNRILRGITQPSWAVNEASTMNQRLPFTDAFGNMCGRFIHHSREASGEPAFAL